MTTFHMTRPLARNVFHSPVLGYRGGGETRVHEKTQAKNGILHFRTTTFGLQLYWSCIVVQFLRDLM